MQGLWTPGTVMQVCLHALCTAVCWRTWFYTPFASLSVPFLSQTLSKPMRRPAPSHLRGGGLCLTPHPLLPPNLVCNRRGVTMRRPAPSRLKTSSCVTPMPAGCAAPLTAASPVASTGPPPRRAGSRRARGACWRCTIPGCLWSMILRRARRSASWLTPPVSSSRVCLGGGGRRAYCVWGCRAACWRCMT